MNSIPSKYIYFNIIISVIFSITISTSDITSQPTSTVGEIFNYEIGDVFHYHIAFGGGGTGTTQYTNIEVLDKFYSNNSDTVYYVLDIASKEQNYPLTYWEYNYEVDTIYYSRLDNVICDSAIVNIDSSLYHGRIINTCLYSQGGDSWMDKWAVGCGLVCHSFSSSTHSHVWDEELVYYKKGSEIWGTPIYVSNAEIEPFNSKVLIFPNPANDLINIQNKHLKNTLIEIYSLTGVLVKRINIQNESTTIDISKLTRGMYLIVITSNTNRIYEKIIKE